MSTFVILQVCNLGVCIYIYILFCHSFYTNLEIINSYNLTKFFLQEYILWKQYNKISAYKSFLNLLDHHFPNTIKLSKIFNRNTIKVSYCCTESMASVIKSHNKKLTIEMNDEHLPCNCRAKYECPLDGKCRAKDVYKCVASTSINPDKVYLGTAEGEFKKRFYNHKKSFKNRGYTSDTSLSKYIWEYDI